MKNLIQEKINKKSSAKISQIVATIFISLSLATAGASIAYVGNVKNLQVPDAHNYEDIHTAVAELEADDSYMSKDTKVLGEMIFRYRLHQGEPIELAYDDKVEASIVEKLIEQAEHLNAVFKNINSNFYFRVVAKKDAISPNRIDVVGTLPKSSKDTTFGSAKSQSCLRDASSIHFKDDIEAYKDIFGQITPLVILHEIMHILGFSDDYENDLTIMRNCNSALPSKLTPNDVKILYCLYGDINDKNRTAIFKEFLNNYTESFFADAISMYVKTDSSLKIKKSDFPINVKYIHTDENFLYEIIETKTFNEDGTVIINLIFPDGSKETYIKPYLILNGVIVYERPIVFNSRKCFCAFQALESGYKETDLAEMGQYYKRRGNTLGTFSGIYASKEADYRSKDVLYFVK